MREHVQSCSPHARRAALVRQFASGYFQSPAVAGLGAADRGRGYAIDARKLENELGWKPAETFESGIRKTVQWYLANPEWVANVQSGAYREWVGKHYGADQSVK